MLIGFPCIFHWLTGLYCPGCGGTRAVYYLLRGQFLKSLQYHPVVLYAVVVVLLQLGAEVVVRVSGNPRYRIGRYELFLYLGLVLILLNCIFKNYMLLVKGIALIP